MVNNIKKLPRRQKKQALKRQLALYKANMAPELFRCVRLRWKENRGWHLSFRLSRYFTAQPRPDQEANKHPAASKPKNIRQSDAEFDTLTGKPFLSDLIGDDPPAATRRRSDAATKEVIGEGYYSKLLRREPKCKRTTTTTTETSSSMLCESGQIRPRRRRHR